MNQEKSQYKVAIVGSGPAGFYAADALLKADQNIQIDILDRLPTPYGLVRSGVAPDHPKIKSVTLLFDKILQRPEVRFFGNVDVGRRVSVETLKDFYHAIIFSYGAETDRKLNIDGEDLLGSRTATEFVGWYNGHPYYRNLSFDLSGERAVIIGQGNVAIDVARILAKTPEELEKTDIAQHALDALKNSQLKEIVIIGRRGPVQAKFTDKELRELGELAACGAVLHEEELALSDADKEELELGKSKAQRNFEHFTNFSKLAPHPKKNVHLRFYRSPVAIQGEERVESIALEKNILTGPAGAQKAVGTGEIETLPCSLIFKSIGYRGVGIEGLPFDEDRHIIPNTEGRVETLQGETVTSCYTSGWIKRGPSGVIGTNKHCSNETVRHLLEDLESLPTPSNLSQDIRSILDAEGALVDYEGWKKIDALEIETGKASGKPREKMTSIDAMLEVACKN